MENIKDICKQNFYQHNVAYEALSTKGIYKRNVSKAYTREYTAYFLTNNGELMIAGSHNHQRPLNDLIKEWSKLSQKDKTEKKFKELYNICYLDLRNKQSNQMYKQYMS